MQINVNNLNGYQIVKTIDAHTEGEPLRIITDGYPDIKGDTILAKRQYLINHLDHLRQLLMYEPRGHADMYGALLTEPCTPDANFGILFMHNEGYSSMCGHGIIAAVSVAIETEAITIPQDGEFIGIDAPAGFIKAYARYEGEQLNVSFDNVPSFIEKLALPIQVDGIGSFTCDIAFGGAYYAFVDADAIGLDCTPANQQALIDAGRAIKKAVNNGYQITHPQEPDLSFLYGTIFYSKHTSAPNQHSRHVCIFADGEVDRSPTGTGVSARIALLKHYQQLAIGEPVTIESIVGGQMTVTINEVLDYHGKDAVIPRVSGRAFITGIHQFMLSASDIFPAGFLLR